MWLHVFLVFCLVALAVWIWKQIPGFEKPRPPVVLVLILLLVLAVLSWVWVGSPMPVFQR